MPNSRSTTIGDLLVENGGDLQTGPFGTKLKASEYTSTGVPVISVGEIGYGRLRLHDKTPLVDSTVTERMPEYVLRHGDIVFGRKGAVDRSAQIQPEQDGWFLGSDGIRLRLPPSCDSTFIAYQLQTPSHRAWMLQHAAGSTMPSLNEGIIRRIPIVLPELDDQLAVATVLRALDDKIEQNRRTGRALEALAGATFKAWFVDFEPAKARRAGKTSFPGMSPDTFATLPDHLTDSAVGPVPHGWAVRTLAEVFDINPPRRLSKGQDAPYLDMKNMPTEGHAPDEWDRRPHGSGMRFINGDTLVARITPCLENGKTAYVDFLDDGEVAWGSTEYIVLRPKPPLPEVYAYCLARTPEFRDFAIQNMTGTSGRQRVAASALEHYHVAVPDAVTATAFGDLVLPLFKCIRAGKAESSKLATVRDYLLPRLLCGAVRVASKAAV